MTPIGIDAQAVRNAVRVAIEDNGLTVADIAQALGLSLHYCRQALMTAKRAGLVGAVRVSRNVVHWMAPEAAQELQRRLDVIRRQRKRKQWREQWAKRTGKTSKPLPGRPVRVTGKTWPLTFKVNAPASVFHLGVA